MLHFYITPETPEITISSPDSQEVTYVWNLVLEATEDELNGLVDNISLEGLDVPDKPITLWGDWLLGDVYDRIAHRIIEDLHDNRQEWEGRQELSFIVSLPKGPSILIDLSDYHLVNNEYWIENIEVVRETAQV